MTTKPTLREQLTAALPDHAAWRIGLVDFSVSWTTPAGIWAIRRHALTTTLDATGPGFQLNGRTVDQILGTLRVLGAIHDPDDAYTELFAQYETALALLVTYRDTHGTITHLDELLDDSGWLHDGTAHIPDDLAARLGYLPDADEDDDPTYDADQHALTVATHAAFLASHPSLRGLSGIHTNPQARDHAASIAAEALAAVLAGDTLTADLSLTFDADEQTDAPRRTTTPEEAQQHIAAVTAPPTLPPCTPGCALDFTHDGFCEPADTTQETARADA